MSWSTLKLILTLSCEQSTRLVSQSLDGRLPLGERLAVRLHAFCCRSCRRFRRQLMFVNLAVHRMAEAVSAPRIRASLSPQARDRIARVLESPGKQDSH